MRLPDPFTHADAPGFTGARLVDNNPVIYDEMPDGEVLRVDSSAQFWGLELKYPELFAMEYAILLTAVAEASRTNDTIDVMLPQYENFRVQGNFDACVVDPGQQGDELIIQNVNTLKGRPYAGDLIKLTGHSKVYKIASFTHDSANNRYVIGLYPRLAETTDGTEKPIFNGITFEMVLTEDTLPVEDLDPNGLYQGFELSLREQIHAK